MDSTFSIRVDILPGYGYRSEALYYDETSSKAYNARIKSVKDMTAAYRISLNGNPIYESRGSGAKKRWFAIKDTKALVPVDTTAQVQSETGWHDSDTIREFIN